eukprot:14146656-Alexandrium_andersonii.AAC.1
MADCGLGRIGALTGLGRIAECILGALRCKDASNGWASPSTRRTISSRLRQAHWTGAFALPAASRSPGSRLCPTVAHLPT